MSLLDGLNQEIEFILDQWNPPDRDAARERLLDMPRRQFENMRRLAHERRSKEVIRQALKECGIEEIEL